MKSKAFTLLEIIIATIIVGILGFLGLYAFQVFPESTKAKTCEANLRILKTALDLYIQDHDAMPSGLSYIPQKYIDRAYAALPREREPWPLRFAGFIDSLGQNSLAYAKPFINSLSPTDIGVVTCPKDRNPPNGLNNQVSYGMNLALAGISIRDYQNLVNSTVLIGDCKTVTFSSGANLEKRHVNYPRGIVYSQAIRKDGIIERTEGPRGGGF